MHSVLAEQLRRLLGPPGGWPPEVAAFVSEVDETYHRLDGERAAAEQSLEARSRELTRANEERLEIVRLLPDLFFRLKSDGSILDCNMHRTEYLLAAPGEVIGRRIQDIATPEVGAQLADALERVRTTGVAARIEYGMADGATDRRYEATLRAVSDGEIIVFIHDITARRAAEGERDRLVAAIEQAAESITITDVTGAIQYMNPSFSRITGYSREEALGRNPRMLQSGEHSREFYKNIWQTLSAGRVWRGRFINRRKDGSAFQLESAISPIRSVTGKVINYVMVGHDVTREVQLEDQLRQSLKMEAIGRLAGGIAHDFNNLLTAIIGNAEMVLARLSPSDPLHDDVGEIKRASVRAAQLTSQLLAFGRRQVLHPKPINLNSIVSEMLRMLRRVLGEQIVVETSLSPDLWPVRADPVQIEQVIMNLCINARDAMPGGGRVAITSGNYLHETNHGLPLTDMRQGEYARIVVSDTGLGMDEKTRSHLFEPFFTTKEMGKGTGLGLATVYGILKQSGGHIIAESAPGKGATFTLYLPRCPEPASDIPSRNATPPHLSGAETILLVEDEEQVRRLTRTLLERHGYRILEASAGEQAAEIARAHNGIIHMMLTDIMMPGINGNVLASRIADIRPGIRILFMSGHPESAMSFSGVVEDERRFIKKPFSSSDLARKVREVLDDK